MDDIRIYLSDVPSKPIYHYTTAEGLIGILTENRIRATNILYLNDSAELLFASDLLRQAIAVQKESFSSDNLSFLEEFDRRLEETKQGICVLQQDLSKSVFVCSFSEDGNQLGQWRAYCPNGNGYSIGFEFWGPLYTKVQKQGFDLRKCRYTAEEHADLTQLFLREAFNTFHLTQAAFLQQGRDLSKAAFTASIATRIDFLEYAPILKHPKFSEENEWRWVSRPTQIDSTQLNFRPGRSMIIPFREIKLAEEQEPFPSSRVYFGPTPHPDLSGNSLNLLLSAKGCHCPIEYSEIPFRGGGLQI